jgi:hypothetical protein
MGAIKSMREEGNAEAGKQPEFKITRRWPELYVGPLFLLAISASVYCFMRAQNGEPERVIDFFLTSLFSIGIALHYLLKRRLRYRVSWGQCRIYCNRPELIQRLTAEVLFAGEYDSLLEGTHRFKTDDGVLRIHGSIAYLIQLAETLFSKEQLRKAVQKEPFLRTFWDRNSRAEIVVSVSLIALFFAPFIFFTNVFGTDAVAVEAWSVIFSFFKNPLLFLFLVIGPLTSIFRPRPKWSFTGGDVYVAGKNRISLKSIRDVQFLGDRASSIRIAYIDVITPSEVKISQNMINKSLIPQYFFLRFNAPKLTAPSTAPNPNICYGSHG